jgi:hypothetical protein
MRSMVEGRREAPLIAFGKEGSLRSRPSTVMLTVPLPSKSRGGLKLPRGVVTQLVRGQLEAE